MANRPIFIPGKTAGNLVREKGIEFVWNPGFSPEQKKKNVTALHAAAKEKGFFPLLEVSTKSDKPLGARLSAFNLKIETIDGKISVESAYQGSKVFVRGGPYTDIYKKRPFEAKKDMQIKSSGDLKHFDYFGKKWGLYNTTAFYDWLYITALKTHSDLLEKLVEFKGFTDIEFNPKKSFNCQARACALLVSLRALNKLDDALESQSAFIATAYPNSVKRTEAEQADMFDGRERQRA